MPALHVQRTLLAVLLHSPALIPSGSAAFCTAVVPNYCIVNPRTSSLSLDCLSFLLLSHPHLFLSSFLQVGFLFDNPSILCLKNAQMVFRSRMWGGLGSIVPMWLNFGCYCRHLALDPTTGLDPLNIAMRPLEGPGGIHEFIPGYPLWGPFFASMAELGYTNKTLVRRHSVMSSCNTHTTDSLCSVLPLNIL